MRRPDQVFHQAFLIQRHLQVVIHYEDRCYWILGPDHMPLYRVSCRRLGTDNRTVMEADSEGVFWMQRRPLHTFHTVDVDGCFYIDKQWICERGLDKDLVA